KWENDDAPDRLSRPRIWVDAICINQNDHVEKAHQVTRMARIYTDARRVIVWLGEHENESRLATQLLQDYATLYPDVTKNESMVVDMMHVADHLLKVPQNQFSARSWQAISNLFNRPYFQRRWVLQEVALGSSIYLLCGEDSVEWSVLAAFLMVTEHSKISDTTLANPYSKAYIRYLWTQCTEKVDHLISLIGILPPEYGDVSVMAGVYDYHQPYWTVFLRFVKSVLQINLHPEELPYLKTRYSRDESKKIISWERKCCDLATRASSSDRATLKDVFSRVLVLGESRFRDYSEYRNRQESVSEIYYLWKLTHCRNILTGNSKHDGPDAVDAYGRSVVLNGATSTFFATVQGQLGFSTSQVQPNDVVYILYGGNAPFVLRPNQNGDSMQLVGDAYIEGVMYGEALTADNKQPDEWVNLV
ncbi:MAG: hypothetical protein Q9205_007436, partial [Flavoplaca limonia]